MDQKDQKMSRIDELQELILKHGSISQYDVDSANNIINTKKVVKSLSESLKNMAEVIHDDPSSRFFGIVFGGKKFKCEYYSTTAIVLKDTRTSIVDVPLKLIMYTLLGKSLQLLIARCRFRDDIYEIENVRAAFSINNKTSIITLKVETINGDTERRMEFSINDPDIDRKMYNSILDLYTRINIIKMLYGKNDISDIMNKNLQVIYDQIMECHTSNCKSYDES